MKHWIAATVFFISVAAYADVYIHPTFSEPAIAGKYLLFASPDEKRLICIDESGKVQWQKTPKDLTSFGEAAPDAFYLQDGKTVFRIDPTTGAETIIGSLPNSERPIFFFERGLSYSQSIQPRRFALRDPRTLALRWRDDRVERVEEADEQRVYALTSVRHDESNGAFSTSDATLVALDRETGRQLWSHRLSDAHALSVGSATVGSWLAIADDLYPTPTLKLIDQATGSLVKSVSGAERGAKGFFCVDASPSGELLVLEAMRDGAPDVLTTFTVPDLKAVKSIPLPAQENLFFFIDGDVVVTCGIYSAAAFRFNDGTKLWEITHQLLMRRPHHGAAYASRNQNDTAIFERIDIETGKEETIYQEPLPPQLTRASLEREAAVREREFKKREEEKHTEEEKLRPRIGDEVCLRYDGSGMLDIREYWLLHRNGVAEYVDAGANSTPIRSFGRWAKNGDVYEIRGTVLVRDVDAGDMSVLVGVRANLELLRDLRDVVEAFLFVHKDATFTNEQLAPLRVRALGCPPEAEGFCSGDGQRGISVMARISYPVKPVAREALDHLIDAIDTYLRHLSGADQLRFRIDGYRSVAYATWLDPHSVWGRTSDEAMTLESTKREIDMVLDSSGANQPAVFRVDSCSAVAAAVAAIPGVTTVDAKPR